MSPDAQARRLIDADSPLLAGRCRTSGKLGAATRRLCLMNLVLQNVGKLDDELRSIVSMR